MYELNKKKTYHNLPPTIFYKSLCIKNKCKICTYYIVFVIVLACTSSMFMCADRSVCIPQTFVCNGNRECLDGTDEANCGKFITLIKLQPSTMTEWI